MRNRAFVWLAVLAVGLAACGSKVELPAVQPEMVELFYPGNSPREAYKLLARIDERGPQDTPDSELIDRARARAAEMGADALIIDGIRATTEGQVELNLGQEIEKILQGRAVYYPAKHPGVGSD